jgi:putative oxidoreductase
MFQKLPHFSDLGILLVRLMVAVVFIDSGWNDLIDPVNRSVSIGMSQHFTVSLGVAEIAGGVAVAAGILTQLAAMGLIVVSCGAIEKKIFTWHTGFWGGTSYGWHYDLLFIVMNLLIIFTDGGLYTVKNVMPIPPKWRRLL